MPHYSCATHRSCCDAAIQSATRETSCPARQCPMPQWRSGQRRCGDTGWRSEVDRRLHMDLRESQDSSLRRYEDLLEWRIRLESIPIKVCGPFFGLPFKRSSNGGSGLWLTDCCLSNLSFVSRSACCGQDLLVAFYQVLYGNVFGRNLRGSHSSA